ncbi:MAG: hypothetical protein LBS94_01940 [Prevotellaceae bacterium]|jgi:phenylpyruvate tautomerase PptA (4-oxalocrotonate tautomerase family)|nr:hypothetical protein [Prevotellaceae bacterium]
MPTLKEKREESKQRAALVKEVHELMLKRANVSKKTLLTVAITRFAAGNLDLLTPAERKKYKSVIVG